MPIHRRRRVVRGICAFPDTLNQGTLEMDVTQTRQCSDFSDPEGDQPLHQLCPDLRKLAIQVSDGLMPWPSHLTAVEQKQLCRAIRAYQQSRFLRLIGKSIAMDLIDGGFVFNLEGDSDDRA